MKKTFKIVLSGIIATNILFHPVISHAVVLSQSKDVTIINQDKVFELDKQKASLVNVTYHQPWGRETRISYMGD